MQKWIQRYWYTTCKCIIYMTKICNLNFMYIMQPKLSSTLYICISYLYNINQDKWLLYQLSNMISKNNLLKICIIKKNILMCCVLFLPNFINFIFMGNIECMVYYQCFCKCELNTITMCTTWWSNNKCDIPGVTYWIRITLYVKKSLSKHGDVCFMIFN
jgi:hypothetical protein